ncbi:LacI family transcriptional regulator (plasmid) [Rhizobium brockwellii]|nr:LacI family transcriptional regulator [Rhizobium brockwellii]
MRRGGAAATVTDVARAAGVSRATAARVLGDYGYVNVETRERVLAAARSLAYQANQLAKSVATGRSKTIGVVVADIDSPYFARAIRAITGTASAHGFVVILATTDEDIEVERDAVRVLLTKRVDGLIISPTSSSEVAHLARLSEIDCPIVLLDRRVPQLRADTFAVDNFRAAYEAVTMLIGRGHTDIALASNALAHPGQHLISSVRERIDGYRAALDDAEIPVDPQLVVMGGAEPQNLAHELRVLCSSPARPTAFLATESSVALVILNVLRELHFSIPDDVSLICFNNPDWTSITTPPLTVISQPIKELATAATEKLIARLTGAASNVRKETLLAATLIRRGSVSDVCHVQRSAVLTSPQPLKPPGKSMS